MEKYSPTKSFVVRFVDIVSSSPLFLFVYFFILNLPYLIATFDTGNWSDDFNYLNLLPLKAQVKPIWMFMSESVGGEKAGGHFAPFYFLLNYLFTLFTINPHIVHLEILLIHAATAVVAFYIIFKITQNKLLALVSATLFTINYYLIFKPLTWNCFHSHLTNTFTGLVSILFLVLYAQSRKKRYLLGMILFFLCSLLNLESGFIYVPILFILTGYFYVKKLMTRRQGGMVISLLLLVSLSYPLGSYFKTGQLNPLGHRFSNQKSLQTALYNASDVLINSTGLGIYYDKLVVDQIKGFSELKEILIQLIRKNDLSALSHLTGQHVFLVIFSLAVMLTICVFMLLSLINLKGPMRVWGIIYGVLAFIFMAIFYRTDIAYGIGFFSAIIVAAYLIDKLQSPIKTQKFLGISLSVLLIGAFFGETADKFEGCYRRSFFGINKIAVKGPYDIYQEMNKKIGHFAQHGLILFTHDYSMYHRTSGFDRIGDMIGVEDFMLFNATVNKEDFFKTDLKDQLKDKTLNEFIESFFGNQNYIKVIVHSRQEALDYIKNHQIDLNLIDVIYLSKDYQVENIGNRL
jgi:hypothetical protein